MCPCDAVAVTENVLRGSAALGMLALRGCRCAEPSIAAGHLEPGFVEKLRHNSVTPVLLRLGVTTRSCVSTWHTVLVEAAMVECDPGARRS